MGKSFATHVSSTSSTKLKINFKKVLNNISIPISLWELKGDDFILLFSNKRAEGIIKPNLLSENIWLSKALPDEYENIYPQKTLDSKKIFSTQIMIEKDILLITHGIREKNLTNRNKIKDIYQGEPFHTIVEQSPVSIIITDIQGNIEYVNPKFVELTGYLLDEVQGKNPRILKGGNKSLEEYRLLWDTILSGNTWKGEFINKRKNGELYYEYAFISPIKDQNDRIINFIAIKEDITKLKKVDEELKKSEKLAVLGKMAAYVSHEIKTPLTSIMINVDTLERNESINDDAKKSLSIIQKEIKRLTNLSKNILQFANHSSLSFSDINLHKKIENIKEFLEPLLKGKGIILLNKTSDHNIFGDAQQLRSLFIHLIENSIESIDMCGEIEIASELKGDQCYIYIKDTGCGVNCTGNIFETFVTTKSTGTGLGLPIARGIVEKHHGSIRLVSSKQGETIFEIVLQSRGERIGKNSDN